MIRFGKMNPVTRSILLLTLALPFTGCSSLADKKPQPKGAAIGQTEAQITKEIGPSKAHYMNGFVRFHDEVGNEVQAHFERGKADSIFYYTFDRKITDARLSSVLKLNSGGRPWVLEASSTSGRKVYHTTEAKLHAFLSRGSQLMVMRDRFFRNVLHPESKMLMAIDDLPECLFEPDHFEAQIGIRESTVIKNYGHEVCTFKDGAKAYSDGYQNPVVHYKNGICDFVSYESDKRKRISDCWVSQTLNENSRGIAWIVAECSKPNQMVYWTPKANLVAQMHNRKNLYIYTTQRCEEWLESRGKKGAKEFYFKASNLPCAPVYINESEASMAKKLGKPKIEKDHLAFRSGDLIVLAYFDHGICNKITYKSAKKLPFSDHWISSTLALNARGRAWLVRESSNAKSTYYNTYDDKFYALLKSPSTLGVCTEKVIQKLVRELDAEKRKALNSSPSKS